MPHWSIPLSQEDKNEGGTFFVNACGKDSKRRTEVQKRVTCDDCKREYAHPTTVGHAAARLYQHVVRLAESNSEIFVRVDCNACARELDVSEWPYRVDAHHVLADTEDFLKHVAYDHLGGSEVNVAVVSTTFSAYELNLAVGKAPMTQHEEAWRQRVEDSYADEDAEASA